MQLYSHAGKAPHPRFFLFSSHPIDYYSKHISGNGDDHDFKHDYKAGATLMLGLNLDLSLAVPNCCVSILI